MATAGLGGGGGGRYDRSPALTAGRPGKRLRLLAGLGQARRCGAEGAGELTHAQGRRSFRRQGDWVGGSWSWGSEIFDLG